MKKIFLLSLALMFSAGFLKAQVIDAAGGGGAYTIASYPGNFTGYYNGFSVVFRANHNTPGASSMTIGGAGTMPIVNTAGNPLAAGDIKINQVVTIVYDVPGGNRFQMVTTSGNVSAGAAIAGTGTATRMAIWTSASSIGNSSMFESASNIGVGITPGGSYKLEVNGLVGSLGINETSDQRYKKNIFTIENALQKVMLLRGVNFDWRTDEFKDKNFVSSHQIGLIAQEVEKIIPQVVTTAADGYKAVEYSKLVALLIEAVKEQNKKIEAITAENQTLKKNSEDQLGLLRVEMKVLKDSLQRLYDKDKLRQETGQR